MVGAVLIFAGEVQVDIGNLVALEAQEDLEGDVEAVLGQVLAAEGAVLVRQVNAHLVGGLVHVEEALAAVDAAVMGRERVDLRDAAHMRHEGRAHRAAGAHQIAVVVGLLHQLLGDVVQGREAVADNGLELLFDAGYDDLRQLLAVHLLRASPGHVLDIVRRVLPQGLEGVLALGVDGEELQFFDLVGDLFRVVDDHLMALFRAEVAEFLQHLVGGLEVQGRLIVRVLKAHAGLDDGAVFRVMGVEEVHVAGGHDGDAQLIAELHDDAVEVAQGFLIRETALAHHEIVVADGLDFEVVVPGGDLLQLLPGLVGQHRLEQLARLAGAADNQALAQLLDLLLGHVGTAAEVLQMADGDELVQVHQAVLGLDQNDDVVAVADGAALEGVQVREGGKTLILLQCFEHAVEAVGRGGRVVDGAVGVLQRHLQLLAHGGELERLHLREHLAAEGQGVDNGGIEGAAQALELRLEQRCVKGGVVSRDGRVPDEVHELRDGGLGGFLVRQHHIGDAGQLDDLLAEWLFRVHQQGQRIHHRAAHHLHRADLDHAVGGGVQARGLKVQHHDGVVHRAVVGVHDHLLLVDHVALAAGNQLNGLLLRRVEGRREGLHHAVIGDGHRRMPPLDGALDQVARRGHGVHGGHVGVHVQLDALFFGGVLALDALHGHHIAHGNGQFAGEVVIHALAADLDVHANLDLVDLVHDELPLLGGDGRQGLVLVALLAELIAAEAEEILAQDGRGIVRHREGHQQHFAALELLLLHLEDVALNDHQARVGGQLLHLDGLVRDGAAHDGLADGGVGHGRGDQVGLFGLLRRSDGRGTGGFLGALGVGLLLLGRTGLLFLFGLGGGHAAPVFLDQLLGGDGHVLLLFLFRAQLRQALLLIARDGQLHRDLQGENVLHRLGEAGGHVLLGHVGHREGVGEGQRDAVVQAAPVDLVHPGDGGRIIAPQEVRQHGLVGADIVHEVLLEARGDHAQGQGLLREDAAQQPFHPQEGGLFHQHAGFKGDVHLALGLDIDHARGAQLALEVGEFGVNLTQQIFVAHGGSLLSGECVPLIIPQLGEWVNRAGMQPK